MKREYDSSKKFQNNMKRLVFAKATLQKRCTYRWWQKHLPKWRNISDCGIVFSMILLMSMIQQSKSLTNVNTNKLNSTVIEGVAMQETISAGRSPQSVHDNEISYGDFDKNGFRPIIPAKLHAEYISSNVFTKSGKYRVFQPDVSDLRLPVFRNPTQNVQGIQYASRNSNFVVPFKPFPSTTVSENEQPLNQIPDKTDVNELDQLLDHYVGEFFDKLIDNNSSMPLVRKLSSKQSIQRFTRNADNDVLKLDEQISRSSGTETGRLFFTAGLKKIMWPIYMGLQILKSLLLAMFLPSLIGSVGQLLGKGIISGSAPLFIRPMDPPQDLDFNFDDDKRFAANDESNKEANNNLDNYNYPTPGL